LKPDSESLFYDNTGHKWTKEEVIAETKRFADNLILFENEVLS